jgi:protein-S-isoprenylcysteine O-methyltransferase Ste14
LRNVLISPLLFFALFFSFLETENHWVVWPLGISIFLLGLALRILALQHLHYRLKVHKGLTMTGPYFFVRNPIYIGSTLICLGATVCSELLWLVPIMLLYCFVIYSLVIRYEESHLLERYGESYLTYMSEVPRWFPKTIRLKDLGIKNEYFRAAIIAEVHCTLIILPFLVKEIILDII